MSTYNGPKVIPTVDIAISNLLTGEDNRILMIRKAKEPLLRFIGGHADVSSDSYEQDAIREAKEEVGAKITGVSYIGSILIPDPRYTESKDKIKTSFFIGWGDCTKIKPMDDVAGGEVKWVNIFDINKNMVMPEHRNLLDMLQVWLVKNNF